jgi:hypothetical protein
MSMAIAPLAEEPGLMTVPAERLDGLRGRVPLHAWSARCRLAVALTIAALAGVLASAALISWDPLDVHAAQTTLAHAQKRHDDAQQALASLPALRAAGAGKTPHTPQAGNSADDIRRLSQLAAQFGLVLHALEPGPAGGAKAEAFRSIKLVAHGSFSQLRRLLEGCARGPVLSVPSELAIRHTAAGLSIMATLRVYDALPALPLALSSTEETASDPFSRAAAPGNDGWRLAGLLQDRLRIVALVETPDGVVTAQAGQAIGDGRVVQIGPTRVVVSSGGSTRTIGWAEGEK